MDEGEIRISSAEREEALADLAEHHAAGRLDANAYEDRRGRANDAEVRREITSLFVDLPQPHPRLHSGEVAPSATDEEERPAPSSPSAKVARTLVALSPFIAVGLFFATGRWWWFLLIPAIAVIARNFEN